MYSIFPEDQHLKSRRRVDFELLFRRLLLKARIHRLKIVTSLLYIVFSMCTTSRLFQLANRSYFYHPILIFLELKYGHLRVQNELPYAQSAYTKMRHLRDWDSWDEKGQNMLQDEKFYETRRKDSPKAGCKLSHDWMNETKPTCNLLHELAIMDYEKIVAHGAYRHVWLNYDNHSNTNYAVKTIKFEQHFSERNLDRHERDAIVLEQLTSSSHIPDIYSYCGHSLQTEYSNEGHIGNLILKSANHQLSSREKLILSIDVAKGLSDLHFVDHSDEVSVVHSDVKFDQFLLLDGKVKLVSPSITFVEGTNFYSFIF